MINLLHGDCLEQMKTLDDNSVDSIVSDPPYGISFMAKKWDYDVPKVEVWKEAMRVLRPGGHALIACGTRTQHRMVVNIEDAGFEIRDVVSWIYGSGFPKSLNIHKKDERCPDGWGTALKPSSEFFTLCRKPLSGKTIAANVLKWGTGGINIDGCRVVASDVNTSESYEYIGENGGSMGAASKRQRKSGGGATDPQGRFPANLIHDGSPEVLELFPETKPNESAARFFYCPKASKKDRDEGNNHPTVKPTALMAYLCRLITPTGGVVLDPYMGSGSTGKAAVQEGFSFVGIELDDQYYDICKARIENAFYR
jgi:DNA modification methylase